MSIFDSVIGDISSLGDALSGALSGTGSAGSSSIANANDNSELRALRLQNLINSDKTNQPYGVNSFRAGEAQKVPTVDSETVNAQWLQRLNRYSSIPQFEGAKAKGA